MDSSPFEYITPTDDQMMAMHKVRTAFEECSGTVFANVPEGPDRNHLLRKLRECGMWANVAITRNPDGTPRT